MALSIRTIAGSLPAQRNLRNATDAAASATERLTTGLRINHANDDAAGYSVASRANADAVVAKISAQNAGTGVSYLETAREAVDTLKSLLSSMDELAAKSASSSTSRTQRAAYSTEFDSLKTEYNRIVSDTEFNYQDIFTSTNNSLTVGVGYGANGQITANLTATEVSSVGNGTFTAGGSWGFASTVDDISLKDVTGDGVADLIWAATGSFQIQVAVGNGNGTFQAATSYSSGRFGNAIADVNNDGNQDIISFLATGSITNILLGNGDGTFNNAIATTNSTSGYGDVADVNNDGNIDIISYTAGGSGAATVMLGNGNGTFKAYVSYASPGGTSGAASLFDFNNDGQLDVVTSNATAMYVSLGNTDGSFKAAISSQGASDQRARAHDVNGDGFLDVVVGAGAASGTLEVFLGNGNGTFQAMVSYQSGGVTGLWDPRFADSNDDGVIDLIVGGTNGIATFLGNGDGTFKAGITSSGPGKHIEIADFNGDGAIDIVGGGGAVTRPTTYIQSLGAVANTRRVRQISGVVVSTQENAIDTQNYLEHEQSNISLVDGNMRAGQARFESAQSLNAIQALNYETAVSKITEVDVVYEAEQLIKNQLFQQAATTTYQLAGSQFTSLSKKLIDGIG